MTIINLFNLLLDEQITPYLIQKGFSRTDHSFNKKFSEEIVWVVDVEPSIANSMEEMEFTFRTSINLPSLNKILFEDESMQSSIILKNEVLSKSIEDIKGNKKNKNYRLNDIYVNFGRLSKTLLDDIEQYIIPYFQKLSTIENITDALAKNNAVDKFYYRGILFVQSGKIEEGKKLIKNYYKLFQSEWNRIETDTAKMNMEQIEKICRKLNIKM